MRIGLIIYGSIDQQTGGYLYDRMLVQALRRDGHTVHIFSLPPGPYINHLADNLRLGFVRRVAVANLDILLQDELNHPSLFVLNRALRAACGCPIVSIVHHLRSSERHPALEQSLYRFVERQYLKSVDGFICNSQATNKAVNALAPSMRSAPQMIAWPGRPARSTPRRSRTGSNVSGPLSLLFVGSVIERKGLRELATALRDMRGGAWALHVAGDDTVDSAYADQCRLALRKVHGDVHWHGYVDRNVLRSLYQEADVLVVPSFHEGFGIVYLEAMGYGIPVVAAKQGGASDFVRDGYNGFLVDPTEPATITRRIEQLLHSDLHKQMGVAAALSYDDHPTWTESMRRAVNHIYLYQDT